MVVEKVPARHSMQTRIDEAPVSGEKVPLGQDRHWDSSALPCRSVYLPLLQSEQVVFEEAPTAAENLPAPHRKHVLSDVAAIETEYVPGRHKVHAAFAGAGLNFPAGQSKHV